MYKVIREFSGFQVGEERDFNKKGVKYLIEKGYIKPLKAEVKADPKPIGRKKKVDIEAEKLLNKES